MRQINQDRFKPMSRLLKEAGSLCSVPGCNEPLTAVRGPGSGSLCRDHQIEQIEYGGLGKISKPHTFHRSWICEVCGQNVLEDHRLQAVEDLEDRHRIARMLLHGDHITRKADGGGDEKENIIGCCIVCHAIKTVLNKDYLKPK